MNNDALAVQDILINVFSYSRPQNLVACSSVNKQWFGLAIQFLWSSLHSQRPLLELLAPLYESEEAHVKKLKKKKGRNSNTPIALVFDMNKPLNWERFNFYANFVKRLTIHHGENNYADSVISTVSLWRETPSLLPNLEELTVESREHEKIDSSWGYKVLVPSPCSPIDSASLFLHSSLKHLQVNFGRIDLIDSICDSGIQTLLAFLHALPKRSPELRTLCLCSEEKSWGGILCPASFSENLRYIPWIQMALTSILPSLRKLDSIKLCPEFMRFGNSNTISHLRNLRVINLCCKQHSLCDAPETVGAPQYNFNDPENDLQDFLALEELSLSSSPYAAARFISVSTSPHIRSLMVQTREIEDDGYLKTLIMTIGKTIPTLSHLQLEGLKSPMSGPMSFYSIDLDTFKPLSALTQMKFFSFTISHQIHFSIPEFEYLISHWPSLEELHITPASAGASRLLPHVLHSLAEYCPNLHKLTIGLDWDKIDHFPMDDIKHKFANLESVDFGPLLVKKCEVADIAVLLTDLSISPSAIVLSHDEGSQGLWRDVMKFMTVAGRYIQRIKYLNEKLLEARDRIGFLESQRN